jgi:hypothetical protein
VKNARLIRAFLVPAFDFIRNDCGFFQGQTVEKLADLFARRCADQSLIGDGANDLMAGRAVRMCLPNEAKENYEQETERFFHLTDECPLGGFHGISLAQLIQGNHDRVVIRERHSTRCQNISLTMPTAEEQNFNVCRHGALFDFKPYKLNLTASMNLKRFRFR